MGPTLLRTRTAESFLDSALPADLSLDRFLYLVPNYDVMAFVSKCFWDAKHRVYFGLVKDFLDRVLETQGTVCGRALSAGAVILSRFAPLRIALSVAKGLTVNSAKRLTVNSAKRLTVNSGKRLTVNSAKRLVL